MLLLLARKAIPRRRSMLLCCWLLNIASFISCHKLAGVALARCSWRSVKNDPPTAERAAHVVAEPIGGLGKPRPWGYSR